MEGDPKYNIPKLTPKKIPGQDAIEKATDYPVNLDELMPMVGEYGRAQILLFFALIPFCYFLAITHMSQMFITLVPEEHHCELPLIKNATKTELMRILIPKEDGQYSKCNRYNVNASGWTHAELAMQEHHQNEWNIVKCETWTYDRNEIPYETIATEMNWVCDYESLPTLAVSIFYIGAIVGGLVLGWISDHRGRMPALVLCNMVGLAGGIGTVFANNFWIFSLCRFLVGFAYDNCYMMFYVVVLEYTGVRWRTFIANISSGLFFTASMCLVPWIAVWTNDWRLFTVITAAPMALAFFTPYVLPESARWLLSKGKVRKCVKIMKEFAQMNRKEVSEDVFNWFERFALKHNGNDDEDEHVSVTLIDLFKHKRVRTITILLCIMWMSTSFVFDGHARDAGSIGSNLFVAHSIGSFTEFPACILLVLIIDRWGRRWPCAGALIIGGVLSVLAGVVPFGIYSTVLAIAGRAAANFSYNLGCQYAAELLPTVVRGQGIAFIHIMGYVAAIISPFVVHLAVVSKHLPLIIMGGIAIVGGFCSLYLPETLGCDLPQNLEDGNKLQNDKFFSFPCRKRRT